VSPAKSPAGAAITHDVLDNGLRVLVAPDRTSPIVAVAVVYDVGFRSEPEGRTGFAHLFEHLMFQGSAHAGKMEHVQLVQGAGGVMNGHTAADVTCYYEALPSEGLELALWLEADRMGALALNEENLANQVSVVEEEIKVNVLNRPYGGFPWIPLPGLAFDTYPNAHNGYGDFEHLEEATLDDAADFYGKYYAPSNAVLAVCGDCDPDQVVELANRHFGRIPRAKGKAPFTGPFREPPMPDERRQVIDDRLVPQPAFAAGYRVPDPAESLPDYLAYAVLGAVLTDGDSSRLRQRLVHRDHLVTDVDVILGTFGNDIITIRDPVLFQLLVFHPGAATTDHVLGVIDEELSALVETGPSDDELERVRAAVAAGHWRGLDEVLGRAVSIGCVEVVHGRAELIMELPTLLSAVEADDVVAAASALLSKHKAVVELRPTGAGQP
jgi:predicted Zn-dependent peptidase